MTNDFSTIPAESNLRDEITVRSDEYEFESANRREMDSMAEPNDSKQNSP